MIAIVAIFLVIAGVLAVVSNSDIFSPSKFLLFFFLLFHAGAVIEQPSNAVAGLMFVTVLIGLGITGMESLRIGDAGKLVAYQPARSNLPDGVQVFFWLISIPSLYAQFFMVQELGGLEGYIRSLGLRVVEWSGYGAARTIINLMSTINIAYFAVGLIKQRPNSWWLLWGAHLLIVLAFGFLSGSRSGLLNVLALLLVAFHYLRRPVRAGVAVALAASLVLFASVLGIARNGFSLEGGELTTGISGSGQMFSFNSFNYGIDPLTLLTTVRPMPLAHGSTFLSLLTNAIPRSIYPSKPDTGGVFLTKNYAGNAWDGYSNLTPTFIGEWAMNFGWSIGIIGYVFSFSLIMWGVVMLYLRIPRNRTRPRDFVFAIDLAIYIHLLWSIMGLMVGEVTNVMLGFLLNQLVPLLLIRAYFVWRRNRLLAPSYGAGGTVFRT